MTLGSPESGNLPNRDILLEKKGRQAAWKESFRHRVAFQQASSTSTESTKTSFLMLVGIEGNVQRAPVSFITVMEQLSYLPYQVLKSSEIMQVGLETGITASLQEATKDNPTFGRWGILFDQQAVLKLFSRIFLLAIPLFIAVPFPKFRFNSKTLRLLLKWPSETVKACKNLPRSCVTSWKFWNCFSQCVKWMTKI